MEIHKKGWFVKDKKVVVRKKIKTIKSSTSNLLYKESPIF